MILPAIILQSLGDESNKENIKYARSISAWAIGGMVCFSGLATFFVTGSKSIPQKIHSKQQTNISLSIFLKKTIVNLYQI
jgi:GPH family glycoside/pentoside/hexuronide:cation symporter